MIIQLEWFYSINDWNQNTNLQQQIQVNNKF